MGQKKQRAAQRRAKQAQQREVARRQAKASRRATQVAAPREHHRGDHVPFAQWLVRTCALDDAADLRTTDQPLPSGLFEGRSLPYLAYRDAERIWGAVDDPALWRRKMPGHPTRAQVAALSDTQILAGLAERGLQLTREQVLEHIETMPPEGSAWTMAELRWLPAARVETTAQDRHFIGLAATELWSRWRGDAPPLERRLDDLADALERGLVDDDVGLVRGMLSFMRALRERLSRPGSPPNAIGGEKLPLSFWQFELLRRTEALPLKDATRALMLEVIAECDRWIEHRRGDPEDSSELIADAMGDLASLCEKLGLDDEAERRYRAALAVDPDAGELDLQLAELLERTATDPERLAEARALREATVRR